MREAVLLTLVGCMGSAPGTDAPDGSDTDGSEDTDPAAHTDSGTDTETPDTDDTDRGPSPRCAPRGRSIVLDLLPLAWRSAYEKPYVVDRRADGRFALAFLRDASSTVQVARRGERLGDPEIVAEDWTAPRRLGSLDGIGTALWFSRTTTVGLGSTVRAVQVSVDDPLTDWSKHVLAVAPTEGLVYPGLLEIADVSADGVADAVVTYLSLDGGERLGVFVGPLSGAWTSLTTPDDGFTAGPTGSWPLPHIADLVGTPHADLLVVDDPRGPDRRVRVMAGPLVASGDPGSPTTVPIPGGLILADPDVYDTVRVGDVDGDGHADLVVANARLGLGRVDVFRGPLPPGELGSSDVWASVVGASVDRRLGDQLLVVDVDGDGADDIVVSEVALATLEPTRDAVPAQWSVWVGLGAGERRDEDVALLGEGWGAIDQPFVGDVDGDGGVELSVPTGLGVAFVTPCPP